MKSTVDDRLTAGRGGADMIDQILQAYADDPMWADHAEVHKRYLRAAVKEIRSLRGALAPFVDRSSQPTSQLTKTINPKIDGMAPLALTVTKAQFMAASAMLDDVGEGRRL